MPKENLKEQILKTIEEKKIEPHSKSKFLVKNIGVWSLSAATLIMGSLAFAVVIFIVKDNDWSVYQEIAGSRLKFTLLIIPYAWFVLLGLLMVVTHYNVRHTKKGYRYRIPMVVLGTVVLSMTFGTVLYATGAGQVTDEVLSSQVPAYSKIMNRRHMVWKQADKGFLAGKIIIIKEPQVFELKDIKGQAWQINAIESRLHPRVQLIPGEMVRIVGMPLERVEFKAKLIIPFNPADKPFHKIKLFHNLRHPIPAD